MQGSQNVYASAVGLALVRQAIDEGSIYFLRFFDSSPKDLHRISNHEEAIKMADTLVKQPYSGGGTSIDNAIKKAITDIKNDSIQFEKVEIMVITDGDDGVSVSKNALDGIKLHSTVIDGQNRSLKAISDTYTQLSSSDL
jgi:uncharacterized protein with von Willebrand factor type A (vWA) domain